MTNKKTLRGKIRDIICQAWDDGKREALHEGTIGNDHDYTDDVFGAFAKRVKEIENPYYLLAEPREHALCTKAFNDAIQAVLKLLEE